MLGTALWFGFMARRAGRNWLPWVLGGALLALVVTTLVFGVAEAMFLPVSHEAYVRFRIKSIAADTLAIVVLGLLTTIVLWRPAPRSPARGQEPTK